MSWRDLSGADVDRLEERARWLRQLIRQMREIVMGLIDDADRLQWIGPAAADFRQHLAGPMIAGLHRLEPAFEQAAQMLDAQAAQQRRASSGEILLARTEAVSSE